ncbi:hypothetical protein IRY61_05085 [Candidatus Saccharibacteria bacterium]|nr:hypothetical protein [Candidatus Saccharibacteria bacterium]
MTEAIQPHPSPFAESLTPLNIEALDETGQIAARALGELGFGVFMNLRRRDLPAVQAIAGQQAVREFCPKDLTARFGDEIMTAAWYAKEPFFFQLRSLTEAALAGYGWTRPEQKRSPELPHCDSTFAVRISDEFAGRGLGTLFTVAIVSGSMALGMRNIGLETWGSNIGAWRAYEKAGAVHVASRPDRRQTILQKPDADGKIADVRRFMWFPQTSAPPPA